MANQAKGYADEIKELLAQIEQLKEEKEKLLRRIDAYVNEFRVCRFCANIHEDCSPTGNDCIPKWRGL